MVEIIGFTTMAALVWIVAWSMGVESDSERRKILSSSSVGELIGDKQAQDHRIRHAA